MRWRRWWRLPSHQGENTQTPVWYLSAPVPARSSRQAAGQSAPDVDFVITFEELTRHVWGEGYFIRGDQGDGCHERCDGCRARLRCSRRRCQRYWGCIKEYYPDTEIRYRTCWESLWCKKILMLAKAGKEKRLPDWKEWRVRAAV